MVGEICVSVSRILKKHLVIAIAIKDIPPLVPSGQDVLKGIEHCKSKCPSHRKASVRVNEAQKSAQNDSYC